MGIKTAEKPRAVRTAAVEWMYLEPRPHEWRKQLHFKGSRLRPFHVWMDMQTNNWSQDEAASQFGLPVEAIDEAVRYCENNRGLLRREAQEEKRRLTQAGVELESPVAH